jgi:FKBP-type peptidyl-prolyl cis-trans isomerase FkpA
MKSQKAIPRYISNLAKFILAPVLIALCISCNKKPVKINESLTIIEDIDGNSIKEDDFLSITYTEKAEDGKLVSSSSDYDDRPALMFRERSSFKGDFFEQIGYLSEGDSAQFKVSIDSIRTKNGHFFAPKVKGKYLIYNIRVNKVVTRRKMNDSLFNAAIEGLRQQVIEYAKNVEPRKLKRYVQHNKLNTTTTASGLQYIVKVKGQGPLPEAGDSMLVNYTGKSLSGKVFETSYKEVAVAAGVSKDGVKYGPVKVPVLNRKGISGFLEAVSIFPVSTKATLVIPSRLGYGADIHNNLQPYTPLVCEIEIVNVSCLM